MNPLGRLGLDSLTALRNAGEDILAVPCSYAAW
jgi:hypothetical protein